MLTNAAFSLCRAAEVVVADAKQHRSHDDGFFC